MEEIFKEYGISVYTFVWFGRYYDVFLFVFFNFIFENRVYFRSYLTEALGICVLL